MKQKGQVQIKMCDNDMNTFIATVKNILLAPDSCDKIFLIIMLMTSGNTCLFQKGVLHYILWSKGDNSVTLPYIAQRKHAFLGEVREKSKKKQIPARKKIVLEISHQGLGHISTRSFLTRDTDNVWKM